MEDWRRKFAQKFRTADEGAALVSSGDVVVFNGVGDNESLAVGRALAARRGALSNVRLRHVCPATPHPWFNESMRDSLLFESGFAGPADRAALNHGWGDYVPWPFGITQHQTEDNRWGLYTKPDVFITKISPPNAQGYCSFGHMTWAGVPVARRARTVIAEIDERMPHTYGENSIHIDQIDVLVDAQPHELETFAPTPPPADEVDALQVIGALSSSLVRDGDTLEVGTGTASMAVLNFLNDKNDLGVHSELVFPQFIELERAGNITGKYKTDMPGKIVAACLVIPPMADLQERYLRHVEMNDKYHFFDIGTICYLPRIAQQHRMVSINNALAIDLTGQGAVDVMPNGSIMSGVGGQLEFMIGANYSPGGRAVSVLLSTAQNGTISRIVPRFPEGAVVTLPRGLVDYVVTEYGIVNIQGKSLRERAEALISIAHPKFREELRRSFYEGQGSVTRSA